jgi:peptide/nickel transport system substrate-binding protein
VRLRRTTALIAPAIVVAMFAAACGGNEAKTPSGGGQAARGALIYGLDTDFPENWLPWISAGNSVANAYTLIKVLPTPWILNPDFTYTPDTDLVTEEPTSEMVGGKQVLTYKIRPEAKWSDGTPIDAKDFKFTAEAQKSADPKAGGCPALINTVGYEQVASIEGSDNDKTVKVTMAKPFPDWKGMFVNPGLIPQHVLDKGSPTATCTAITKGWPTAGGIPGDVSGGPWQLKASNIDPSKKVAVLTPNESYWADKPKLQRFVVQYIGNDPTVIVKAMQSSEVNGVYPQPQLDLVANLKKLEPKITNKISFGLSFEHIDMNTTNFHLKDPNVRKAIALGLDRPTLVQSTVGQFDSRAQVDNNRMYVNNQPEYKDNSGGAYDKPDAAKAESLLKASGYTKGSDGIYVKQGKRLSLELMTTQKNPLRSNTIDIVTSQLKKIGIEIKKFENPDIFAGKEKPRSLEGGQFDMALFAWVASPLVTANISIYRSPTAEGVGQNYSRGSDKKVDALLDKMSTTVDPAALAQVSNETDAALWADMFTLPLYQKPVFLSYDSNYAGVEENATNAGPWWASQKIALKQ